MAPFRLGAEPGPCEQRARDVVKPEHAVLTERDWWLDGRMQVCDAHQPVVRAAAREKQEVAIHLQLVLRWEL